MGSGFRTAAATCSSASSSGIVSAVGSGDDDRSRSVGVSAQPDVFIDIGDDVLVLVNLQRLPDNEPTRPHLFFGTLDAEAQLSP